MFNFEEEKKRKFCFELNFNYIKYLTSKNDKYLYLPETINKKNKKARFYVLCDPESTFPNLFYRYRHERTVNELWASVIEEPGKASMTRIFHLNT